MHVVPAVAPLDRLPKPTHRVWLGDQPVPPMPDAAELAGAFVDLDGDRFYRISQYDVLPPFFMTIVSAYDHWLFVSSTGGMTAGRRDVERAIFPYAPVDRIHDAAHASGAFSSLLITRDARTSLWEPLSHDGRLAYRLTRHLYKSTAGHRLCFEEINHDLGLTFRAEWTTSDRFGFLRRSTLVNDSDAPADVRVLDGLRNLIPAGIPQRLQDGMSCLTDAYKRTEVVPQTTMAVFALTAAILDQAVAMESLLATVAWSDGLPDPTLLLTERQIEAFRRGVAPTPETSARGVRGLYAVCARFPLAAGAERRWMLAADQGLDQVAVTRLAGVLRGARAGLEAHADAQAGGRSLRAIVGSADGLQSGGDEMAAANHFANVLFNVMRGGVFARGYTIVSADFARFVAERNRAVSAAHLDWLTGLSRTIDCEQLGEQARSRGDASLERLYLEYLPLGFSRRHGDPSRPWNKFSIRLRGADGAELLEYQGNWRDIFQNWEALGASFPGFLGHMVAKFVNGSTIDGYNAYRVTRAGVEWEEPAPEDPWATIGYWGDHQVVYLLALLESAERSAPGQFHQWLEREVFAYTAVPYRIAGYEEMRRDPRSTITFLPKEHHEIHTRETREGTDARLVRNADGGILHVSLTEKLLLVALVRLANLIPGGGIWMNTQRPEWNDANNALVGYGVSVVTLAHLRRYLVLCRNLFAAPGSRQVRLSAAVAEFAAAITRVLLETAGAEARVASDPAARRRCVDQLAAVGSGYRTRVYSDGLGSPATIGSASLLKLLDAALPLVDASLHAARRGDGLFHSYRLLHFTDDATLPLEDLQLMLEGQVAVLASGLLSADEAVTLLKALRASALYRADQHSYLLYPDGSPQGFLQRNVIPAGVVDRTPLLQALLQAGDERLVRRDESGAVRFHHELVNEAALDARLALLAADERGAEAVRAAYEEVFRHRAFLGRSGTMFAYEGLGSIYWHMVSKLLVAVQECHAAAHATRHPAAEALADACFEVRRGLGFNKTPAEYGAFPSDPYSHTPGHAGAQQPGMTGLAKEGVLARWGELGVRVANGLLGFAPSLIRAGEFSAAPHTFTWIDTSGQPASMLLPAGTLAFTYCGTPVVYHLAQDSAAGALVTLASGETVSCSPTTLSEDLSHDIFLRRGRVRRIDVSVESIKHGTFLHNSARSLDSSGTD